MKKQITIREISQAIREARYVAAIHAAKLFLELNSGASYARIYKALINAHVLVFDPEDNSPDFIIEDGKYFSINRNIVIQYNKNTQSFTIAKG